MRDEFLDEPIVLGARHRARERVNQQRVGARKPRRPLETQPVQPGQQGPAPLCLSERIGERRVGDPRPGPLLELGRERE